MAKRPIVANQPHREELYNMAVTAAREGNRQGAKVLLGEILQQDRRNTRAMMWMAKLSPAPAERRRWLNRVLDVDPENETAQKLLDKMAYGDAFKRNRLLFRLGIGGYIVVVILVALLLILVFAF